MKSDAEVDRRVAEAKAAKERADADRQRLAKAREDARQAQARLEEEKRRVAASESKPRNNTKAKVEQGESRETRPRRGRESEGREGEVREDRARGDQQRRQIRAGQVRAGEDSRSATRRAGRRAEGREEDRRSEGRRAEAGQTRGAGEAGADEVGQERETRRQNRRRPPIRRRPPSAAGRAGKPATDANGAPEFRWPARGRVIQGFKANGNDEINIALPEGTSVKAAEGGVVAYAGSELKGYGNLVLIRHPNGFVSAYAHNGDIAVKRGEQVKRSQTIARSGQWAMSPRRSCISSCARVRRRSIQLEYLAGL